MEALRESAEDYECLVMLRDWVAAAGKRSLSHPPLDRARKLLAEAAPRVCDAREASALVWATDKNRNVADQVWLEILETLAELSSGGKQ